MLNIEFSPEFFKIIEKIRDSATKEKIKKRIEKIVRNPTIGKPMGYNRKGTREVYISPYRLSYAYVPKGNKLIFLEIYHKDEQ